MAVDEIAQTAIAILDAADLNIAAFDSFTILIPAANAAGAWVHIDGAFGLVDANGVEATTERAKHGATRQGRRP